MKNIIETVADHTLPYVARDQAYSRPLASIGLSRVYRSEGWENEELSKLPDVTVVESIASFETALHQETPQQLWVPASLGMSLQAVEKLLDRGGFPKVIFMEFQKGVNA